MDFGGALDQLLLHAGIPWPKSTKLAAPPTQITKLCDDSRSCEPGCLFVAVRGGDCDGHEFVADAVQRGAVAVVIDRDIAVPPPALALRVADSRTALARLAAVFHGLSDRQDRTMRLVGITGTNGKSTVAWLTRSILRQVGQATALMGTIEYDLVARRISADLTTPGPLVMCEHLAEAEKAGAAFAVLEVSSHALDQRRCDGLKFDAAVFTNLSGDHLDYHKTMDRYAAAKRRLFDLVDADGVAMVNGDDPAGRTMVEHCNRRVLTFALDDPTADYRARIDTMDLNGTDFTLLGPDVEVNVRLPLVGRHNVANALASAATAHALGVSVEMIVAGLGEVAVVPGRLQRVEPDAWQAGANRRPVVLIDYAHTDAALASVLGALKPLTRKRGRLICVFGCGGDRDRSKRPRMAAAVYGAADVAIVTSDNPRGEDPQQIVDEIMRAFPASGPCRVQSQVDRRLAIETALAEAGEDDTILIAGKGHETYQLIGDRVLAFDDAEVVRTFVDPSVVAEGVV